MGLYKINLHYRIILLNIRYYYYCYYYYCYYYYY